MRPPIFVRRLTEAERVRLEAGLHSKDLYVLRRCQILLASARGEWVPRIAELLGCNDQSVRNVTQRFFISHHAQWEHRHILALT